MFRSAPLTQPPREDGMGLLREIDNETFYCRSIHGVRRIARNGRRYAKNRTNQCAFASVQIERWSKLLLPSRLSGEL